MLSTLTHKTTMAFNRCKTLVSTLKTASMFIFLFAVLFTISMADVKAQNVDLDNPVLKQAIEEALMQHNVYGGSISSMNAQVKERTVTRFIDSSLINLNSSGEKIRAGKEFRSVSFDEATGLTKVTTTSFTIQDDSKSKSTEKFLQSAIVIRAILVFAERVDYYDNNGNYFYSE
jgi:hypothetical protein